MTLTSTDHDPLVLAARVAQAISATYQIAYAQLAQDLTVVQHSPNFSSLLPVPEIIGRPITDLLWELAGVEEVLGKILLGQQPAYRLEHVHRELADGSMASLDLHLLPLEANEPDQGLLLLVVNEAGHGRFQPPSAENGSDPHSIKQQLKEANEQLKRLNQLKSILLSIASHDLRTPLTSINGYASLILNILPDNAHPSIPDYLTIVMRQAGRLNGLISDLLDLDQIEAGQLTLDLEPFDFREIIEEVTSLMQANADNRGNTLEIILSEKPLILWADRDKLYRVVYNLVGNAIKHTPPQGHIKVQAGLDSDKVVLDVVDNGRGLTEEQLANLFQLYCRSEDAPPNKILTSEPGLYLVKKLVEAHQGRVQVASHPERGSIFTIFLPSATGR